MITFILLAFGIILVVAAILLAYAANHRKRAGQSGEATVTAEEEHATDPEIGRAPGND